MVMNALNGVWSNTNYHPARIPKGDKDFEKRLDFEELKFPVKVRKKRKKIILLALAISVMETK